MILIHGLLEYNYVCFPLLVPYFRYFQKRNAAAIASGGPLFRDAVDELMGGKTPESLMNRLELNEVDAMGIDAPGAEAMMAQLKDMPLAEEVQTKELPQRGYPHTPYHPGSNIDNSYSYNSILLKPISNYLSIYILIYHVRLDSSRQQRKS